MFVRADDWFEKAHKKYYFLKHEYPKKLLIRNKIAQRHKKIIALRQTELTISDENFLSLQLIKSLITKI